MGDQQISEVVVMTDDRGNCIDCGTELCILDDDPNGDRNATCAQCRAQDEHDFDVEPHAVFSRAGERIDDAPAARSMPQHLSKILAGIPQQPQRQDSNRNQLADLHTFANRLGLYDAADAIKGMTQR